MEELAAGEVQVWLTSPVEGVSAVQLESWAQLLATDERRRVDRYSATAVRQTYVVARALLRNALSSYAGVEPSAWRFCTSDRGRPEIAAPRVGEPMHFNLSHCEGLIACAVSRTPEVGVDVEWMGRAGRLLALARRYFDPREAAEIESAPEAERHPLFLRYWTLKEAYLKARGLGIANGLDRCRFHIDGSRIEFSADSDFDEDPEGWSFVLTEPRPRHLLTVALRAAGTEPRVSCRWWPGIAGGIPPLSELPVVARGR